MSLGTLTYLWLQATANEDDARARQYANNALTADAKATDLHRRGKWKQEERWHLLADQWAARARAYATAEIDQ